MDTRNALENIRRLCAAPIVMKRGPQGCVVFDGAIPADLDKGILGPGFAVEVFNIVGAGDGFLSGFLSGWLRDASWRECCRRGNACGALVVSRHGCSPASPTDKELAWYLENATGETVLNNNRVLEAVHRATTRRARRLPVLVIDCEAADIGVQSHSRFGSIVAGIVLRKRHSRIATGIMVGGDNGRDALFAVGSSDWVVRGIEIVGHKPLSFLDGKPAGVLLRGWPQNQIVKCVVPMIADASRDLQNERLRELQYAVEMWGHELMLVLELGTAPTGLQLTDRIQEIQAFGIHPDWWGIQATAEALAWTSLQAVIETSNPMCRGVLMLDDGQVEIIRAYRDASRHCSLLRGIVAGKSIFSEPLRDWDAGHCDDATLARNIEAGIGGLIAAWPGRE